MSNCGEDFCSFESNEDYQTQAMRTNDGQASRRLGLAFRKSFEMGIDVPQLLEGCLGLLGESGEFGDIIKKWIFYEQDKLDVNQAQKELGDVCWYITLICDAMKWNLNDIMRQNIEKLRARYPDGFTAEKANEPRE